MKESNRVIINREAVKFGSTDDATVGMSIIDRVIEVKSHGEGKLENEDSKHDDEEVSK